MTTLTELDTDPHPAFARLRAREPVSWLPEAGLWLVTGWHDVLTVLSDPKRYAGDYAGIHDVFRTAYQPGLSPAEVDTITRPIARKAADDVFAAGAGDLTTEYFEPVAAVAGATLLGLGFGCTDTLLYWGNTLARVETVEMTPDVTALIDQLRRRPRGSLVRRLVNAEADPVPLLRHLALSVIEPGWLAAWTLLALWTDRTQLDTVLADRQLLGAAVYEALRWGGPVGVLFRRTVSAVSLGGQEIRAGDRLALAIASANRDEAVFDEPDRFDVRRVVRSNLGFGAGAHHCPAHPMVLSIARTTLDVLLDRMPDVRPALGWLPAPHGWRLRLPGRLDAVWSPQRILD
ncbi:cytochrome P450 [Actinophytocola sp.]|uniref:cytochrome P450 n=1 Tax=Actinophytocola sp. TaxID=1872138 RepID=UPI002ED1950B